MLQKIKNFANRINPIFLICGYILLIAILIVFKAKPYNYNISSLIGIWKGFSGVNANLIESGFIIYNDGGYDGQFFYLISKSMFTNGFDSFPILDSFFLRFNRLGLPILSGLGSVIIGFNYYPQITLFILILFHLFSFLILRKMLRQSNEYLAIFYLFSPFSLNSILLLVSDSLFVSFSVICIFLLKKIGTELFKSAKPFSISGNFLIAFTMFIFSFTCFIRESGTILIGTFLLICLYDKQYKNSFLIFFSILSYILITFSFKLFTNINPGTNPMGFLELIDYPLFGFFKSIHLQSFSNLKSIFRELAKFPIFFFYTLLLFNMKNVKNFRDLVLCIPILFILFTAGVGEVGYWLSFDNISRMFALSIVWIIFLKDSHLEYNDYLTLPLSLFILLLLIIRIIYIKSPMTYYIF